MIDITFEITQSSKWGSISLAGKTNAWKKPSGIIFRSIRTLDEPLLAFFIKGGTVDVFVERRVVSDIPLLFNIFEVSAELLPSWVAFLECKILPKLFVEELINGRISINTGAWVAVPIPDSS